MNKILNDDLLKSIYCYFDLKESVKYLLYFEQSENFIKFKLTNGFKVWFYEFNDSNEILNELNTSLKKDDYELNKISDSQIEIELKSKNRFKLKLEPVKSNENELKELVFNMFSKLSKCEQEMSKLSSKFDSNTSGSISNELNNCSSSKQTHTPQPKRFNLNKQQIANVISPRKPYMSVINPKNKRRKTPKGVEFEEDDNEDSESDNKT